MGEISSPHAAQNNTSSWNQLRPAKISRLVSILLFIVLPFIGFYLGKEYQKTLVPVQKPIGQHAVTTPTPTNESDDTELYHNEVLGFQFNYPKTWILEAGNHNSPPCTEASCDTSIGYTSVHLEALPVETFGGASISVYKVHNDGRSIRDYFNEKDYACCGDIVEDSYLGDRIMDTPVTQFFGYPARKIENPSSHGTLAPNLESTWTIIEKETQIYIIDITTNLDSNPELFQTHVDQILSTFKLLDKNPSTAEILVSLQYLGGLCLDGVCKSEHLIYTDGTVLVDGNTKDSLNSADLNHLIQLINATDYQAIKDNKFTGTCPIAYDGQEATYTFYTSQGPQQIASCTVALDSSHPLFFKVNQVLE